MKSIKKYYFKIGLILSFLVLLFWSLLGSWNNDFKVYSVSLDEVNANEDVLYIRKIDFRYLSKENKLFNEIVFSIESTDSIFSKDQLKYVPDRQKDIDIWIIYKDKKYKPFQKFLSIYEMYEGRSFTVECSAESMDQESELYSFYQQFDEYNTRGKIEKLKQELPKIKLYVSLGDEIVELKVTSKTKAVYTKVPNRMEDISINYD